jgi:hypothetical protein
LKLQRKKCISKDNLEKVKEYILKKLLILTLTMVSCSKPLWLTDQYSDAKWQSITDTAPFSETTLLEGKNLPKNRYGFIITTTYPDPSDEPARVYPRLYQNGQYEDGIALALDPWVVFHEFTDSSLPRARAENPGQGFLLLPGAETDAVSAWTAQFIQSRPGLFPSSPTEWDNIPLFANGQFQTGAQTYNWVNTWEVFFDRKPSWIYAPYSAVRSMAPVKTAGFEAHRFPTPADWDSYGVQAAVLWAVPYFKNAKEKAKLDEVKAWLVNADTQKRIADAFGWLPAHPNAPPANALARSVQMLCARSAFIWSLLK